MGNVLNNMDINHWSGLLSRALLTTTMLFAYPLNLFIARHVCVVLFFKGRLAHDGADSIVLIRRDRRILLTLALYISSLIPALFMESTGKVLSATGAVGGSSLAYIGPGMAYVAIHSNEFIYCIHRRWKNGSSNHLWRYPNINNLHCLDSEIAEEDKKIQCQVWDAILWYISGMPLWSTIACIGQVNLKAHFEKDDTASPSIAMKPNRVTVVKPTWNPTIVDEQKGLIQSNVESKYGAISENTTTPNSGELLQRTLSLSSVEVRQELKSENEVPTWTGFMIAICYITLGVVAMICGLVSIMLL